MVLVVPPGAGDGLQASKRGVMEIADIIAVNKADAELLPLARRLQVRKQDSPRQTLNLH